MKVRFKACCAIVICLCLSGCNGNSPQKQDIVVKINEELSEYMVSPKEASEECKKLAGTKYNQFTLPEVIFLDENAHVYSFEAGLSTKNIVEDNDRLYEILFDKKMDTSSITPLTGDHIGEYSVNESDQVFLLDVQPVMLTYINHIDSVKWQVELQNANYLDGVIVDPKSTDDALQAATAMFGDICGRLPKSDYSYGLEDYVKYDCLDHRIDFFRIDTMLDGVRISKHHFPNDFKYSDGSPDGVYRFSEGSQACFSMIDMNELGAFEITVYSEPENKTEYKKILSPSYALKAISDALAADLQLDIYALELVYVGETTEIVLPKDENGKEIPSAGYVPEKGNEQKYVFHPFWILITTSDTPTVVASNGRSAYLVDALSGDVSTYTEVK